MQLHPIHTFNSELAREFYARIMAEDYGSELLINEKANRWAVLFKENGIMVWVGENEVLHAQRYDYKELGERWEQLRSAYERMVLFDRDYGPYPTVTLTKVSSQQTADNIVANLQGVSFMQFVVEVCPYQGELLINVSTRRADTRKEELVEMLLMTLTSMAFSRSNAKAATLKTTQQQRDDWRRDVPIRGMLRNDFIDSLCDDVDNLLKAR